MGTKKFSASEEELVKAAGQAKWEKAYSAALLFVRNDNRFIGLDKVRIPVAHTAAMHAIGGQHIGCPVVAKLAASKTREEDHRLARELDDLIVKAADAAREAIAS